ncbi:YsnF/AvaK domain-containing protein [Massilia sp. IC2-477]|uniref:YsnF/AvaK domain-containing protein n=1 Tax=Massilia sp. IC2-477 TaxID=2887198 RepID=UPI001D126054|nr:YsnF/AvaK domain-containing protein [Massilia sp. IC2-477]MCC2955639.1 YsnF/AvaK domain-containing protein [Massilia sp. IC2-477]
MQHTLVAVFDNRTDAQNALNELLSSGFSSTDARLSGSDAGSATSASSGADDDLGIGGGIKSFFSNLFGTDNSDHANRYEGAVTRGQHVLTVTADSLPEVERAADLIERYGPTDIDEHSDGVGSMGAGALLAGSGSGMSSSSMSSQSSGLQSDTLQSGSQQGLAGGASLQRDTQMQTGATGANIAATQSIPVVEEQLKVGKREVQRGGVRIYSRIVETPVNESIGLREEHVDVQRRVVDQPISPADATAFKEQTIEMRETAEEAVVEKSARIVEEVTLGKQVNERQEQITDTVRHTEVDVQRVGGTMAQSDLRDDDSYFRNHFTSNYGSSGASYDDYAPAYSYGSQMASSGRYSGRQWDDVESDLRTDWESRGGAGGASTWEKMKAAVRHGWDRMTGDTGSNRTY